MIKKVYIYKDKNFLTYNSLVNYLNKNEITPDKIISISKDKFNDYLDYIKLIYYVKEFREYRKDGTYEKIC